MHPRRAAPGSLSFFAGRFETEDDPCPATLRRACPSMGWHLSGGLAVDGADLPSLSEAIWEGQSAIPGETEMMGRFCRYVGKVFDFGQRISQLVDRRKRPRLPRGMLSGINHQVGRNKALKNGWPFRVGVVDGHEFFSLSEALLSGVLSA